MPRTPTLWTDQDFNDFSSEKTLKLEQYKFLCTLLGNLTGKSVPRCVNESIPFIGLLTVSPLNIVTPTKILTSVLEKFLGGRTNCTLSS